MSGAPSNEDNPVQAKLGVESKHILLNVKMQNQYSRLMKNGIRDRSYKGMTSNDSELRNVYRVDTLKISSQQTG